MAKLRAVNGMTGPFQPPRSEEEFLGGAPIALPEIRNTTTTSDEIRNTTASDETRNTIALDAEGPDDDIVSMTIRIPRRLKRALEKRATDDDRSASKIVWRLLAPLLE